MLPFQPNLSLIDGITVLQAVTSSSVPLGSREVARMLGMEHTRANRFLKTLVYTGMLRQTADRKYSVGPGIHIIAAQSIYASGILRVSVPELDGLLPLGYLVSMGVLWRGLVSYLYHKAPRELWSGSGGMPAYAGLPGAFPAMRSGLGVALVSALDDAQIKRFHCPESDAGGWRLIAETREAGYAFVQGGGTSTLAVCVGGEHPFAAIGLAGHMEMDTAVELLPRLRNAAAVISEKMTE